MKWLLSATLLACATASHAQVCVPYDAAVLGLQERFGELPIVRGLEGGGNIFELYFNPETGTFTALSVTPQGVACMLSAGEFMDFLDQPPRGEPS